MRIGLFLLLFPSLAFAIGGCPVGVQLGNVTIATRLPICLKFDSSEFGGCLVNCGSVCVELPLANTKGPVETTGTSCNYSDNGSGNGDSDGSGNTPDEGASGTKPIDGWIDFAPVIGDATGTSVSGSVAKLNKNLGVALRHLVEKNGSDSANLNSISHAAQSVSRDMNTALYHLERTANESFYSKNTLMDIMGRINTSNDYLQSINTKMDNFGSAPSGGGSTGGGETSSSSSDISAIRNDVASLKGMTQSYMSTIGSMSGDTQTMASNLRRMSGDIGSMNSTLSSLNSVTSSQLGSMSGSLSALVSMNSQALRNGWGPSGGSSGGSSGGDTDGNGIDYSRMPGDSSNPLFVDAAFYESHKCLDGAGCFFDLPTINKKLEEANKALTNQYQAISEDVKQVFSFNLTGSAEPMECLDLFSFHGKDYTVCPPSADYWQTLAALMMFIFYFVALMIIFKR